MTLQELAYIGDLIAAAGVIASLVYLAIQIKRGESTTRAATTQDLLSKSIDMILSQDIDSPLIKASCGHELSDLEKAKLDQLYFARFSHFNDAYHQNEVGKLDPEIWEMYDARTRRNISQIENFELWWERFQMNFTPSFRTYIEEMKDFDAEPKSVVIEQE